MRPDGIGELFLAYEQLKQRLELEGLFAIENKKDNSFISQNGWGDYLPTGAAIRDIITTIKRRYPSQIFLFFLPSYRVIMRHLRLRRQSTKANQHE